MVGLLYGANYSIIKVVTPQYVDAFGFIVLRVGITTVAFWVISFFGENEKVEWKNDGWRIAICALFGMGINMLLFFKGLSLTSAINSSIIMTLTPLLIFLGSVILLKEKMSLLKIIGLVIGLCGAFIIIFPQNSEGSEGNWVGDLFILLNATFYGLYLVIVKPLLAKYKPITIVKWAFLMGFVFVLPFGLQSLQPVVWSELPMKVYLSMGYSIIGVTVIVYIINIWAMKTVSPSTVGAYIYVQPVFATAIAIAFLGEQLRTSHVIASILVFIGVAMVIKGRQ
ncbi:MAG: drug/metabolite transporter (DMT)-like permease [Marinoscillum sp.]|jgi:drug/metabolite transporter (DMT)-like permease